MGSTPQLAPDSDRSLTGDANPAFDSIAPPAALHPKTATKVNWPRRMALALITFLALGSGITYLLPAMRTESPPIEHTGPAPARAVYPDPSAVSLSGNRVGRNIEITWNASAPVFASARIGLLSISDGEPPKKEITLTSAQLQARKFVYTPETDRVEAILEVFSSDRKSTRESVMFILPPANVSAPAPLRPRAPVLETRRARTDEQFRARRFVPPSRRSSAAPERVVILEPPPLIAAAQNRVIPNWQPPSPDVAGPPTPAGGQPKALAPAPISIRPARAIRQVRPVMPPSLAGMLPRSMDISVRIRIDAQGRVVHTEPLVAPGRLNQYLGSAAVAAAKMWRFEPAQRGDERVPDTMILKFTFEPRR